LINAIPFLSKSTNIKKITAVVPNGRLENMSVINPPNKASIMLNFSFWFSKKIKMIKEIFFDKNKEIMHTHKHFPKNVNLISGDTETKPDFLLGVYNEELGEKIIGFSKINKRFENFLKLMEEYSKSGYMNVCYFHNLKFDMQVIMLGLKEKFKDVDKMEIYFDSNTYQEISTIEYNRRKSMNTKDYIIVFAFFSKTWFMSITYPKQKFLKIYDSYAFFKSSLENLSTDLNLEHKKYKVDFNTVKSSDLKKYLVNDLKTQYDLSKRIIDFHRHYDIKLTVSIAQLSQLFFTNRCFTEKDKIKQPDKGWINRSILSYHGGKNGIYIDKVIKINDVKMLDVKSMYPYAMVNIPNMNMCSYIPVKKINRNFHGIYRVTGKVIECKYPILFTHDFKPIKESKRVVDLCLTSYELYDAIDMGEFIPEKVAGLLVKESKERPNPLKFYVDYFYEKKNKTPKDHAFYPFYKNLLTNLYGKFIQNIKEKCEIVDVYNKTHYYNYKGGGLFNPFLASLITGFSRAYIHRLEHQYESIHTATDSIITTHKKYKTGKNLGDLELECSGDLYLMRNKCYVIITDEPTKSKKFPNFKFALHGFHGELHQLMQLYLNKTHEYKFSRFVNIKESIGRKDKPIIPCEWNDFTLKFKIKWENE